MTRRPPELEAMLEELVKRKDIPSNAAAEIEEAVLTSISLRERMVEAATASRPLLKHIGVAPPGSNTGGYYDSESRTLFVAAEAFDEQKRGGVHRRVDYVTGVMGHEVAHALLDKERQQATNALRYGIRQALEKGGDQATLDLTELTDHYLKFSRWDESVSEIGGINAVSSRVTESANGEIDQGEILKRAQISSGCVIKQGRGLALAPDISMGSDGKIAIINQDQHGLKTQTGNIEAVAQCHFDGGQKSLGKGGATNYQNYYGAAALEIIANEVEYNRQRQQGVTPEIKLDLASLQLDAGQMQAAGINLDLGKVQGREVRAFTLLDTSQGAPQQVVFRHSRTPGKADQHPDEQAQETAPRQADLTPADPAHADNAQFLRLQAHVQTAYGKEGVSVDTQAVTHTAAGLLRAIKQDNNMVKRVDAVELGKATGNDPADRMVAAVYKPFGEKSPMFNVSVDAAVEKDLPLDKTFSQVETANLQLAHQLARDQQQAQQQLQPGPKLAGP